MANQNPLFINDGANTVIRDTVTQPERAAAVTPSDSTTFEPSTLYVAGTGAISVETPGGDVVLFSGVVGWFPVKVVKVRATGTTATGIVRLFNT
jgi:hypothetical protein